MVYTIPYTNYKQLNDHSNLLITNLEDHKLVIWFWSPCIDVDAIRQSNDEEFDSLVLHYTQQTISHAKI